MRQLLSLPNSCAKPALYILSGQLPIAALIHKKALSLWGSIIRNEDSIEYKLAERQLMLYKKRTDSWFLKVSQLMTIYDLPTALETLQDPPGKNEWARAVKRSTNLYWTQLIQGQAKLYSTLDFLNTTIFEPGVCHPLVQSVKPSQADTRRVGTVLRFATNTLMLQSNRHRFNQYQVNPSCPLCSAPLEDRRHVLLECEAYQEERQEVVNRLLSILDKFDEDTSDQQWIQLFVDCSDLSHQGLVDKNNIPEILFQARVYIQKVYQKRALLLEINC